jgi:hypothetical protein
MTIIGAAVLVLFSQPAGQNSPKSEMILLTHEYDEQLNFMLSTLISSAQIGPHGEVFLNHAVGEKRFLEPNSGLYWQISGGGQQDFRSRSLGNRRLRVRGFKSSVEPRFHDSGQYPNEPLRVVERTVRLPGSDVEWTFVVARAREEHR